MADARHQTATHAPPKPGALRQLAAARAVLDAPAMPMQQDAFAAEYHALTQAPYRSRQQSLGLQLPDHESP